MILRPAQERDRDCLLEWRNEKATREASLNRDPIGIEEHANWLAGVLANPKRQLLIAEQDGQPVGVVRLDEDHELSWTVAPAARGRGVGREMVSLAVERAGPEVWARIRNDNLASLKIARQAGLEPWKTEGELCFWRLPRV